MFIFTLIVMLLIMLMFILILVFIFTLRLYDISAIHIYSHVLHYIPFDVFHICKLRFSMRWSMCIAILIAHVRRATRIPQVAAGAWSAYMCVGGGWYHTLSDNAERSRLSNAESARGDGSKDACGLRAIHP